MIKLAVPLTIHTVSFINTNMKDFMAEESFRSQIYDDLSKDLYCIQKVVFKSISLSNCSSTYQEPPLTKAPYKRQKYTQLLNSVWPFSPDLLTSDPKAKAFSNLRVTHSNILWQGTSTAAFDWHLFKSFYAHARKKQRLKRMSDVTSTCCRFQIPTWVLI